MLNRHLLNRNDKEVERREKELELKIRTLTSEFESIRDELKNSAVEEDLKNNVLSENRKELIRLRGVTKSKNTPSTIRKK